MATLCSSTTITIFSEACFKQTHTARQRLIMRKGYHVGCGSASLKLCICSAASPWSQSPSQDSQCMLHSLPFYCSCSMFFFKQHCPRETGRLNTCARSTACCHCSPVWSLSYSTASRDTESQVTGRLTTYGVTQGILLSGG